MDFPPAVLDSERAWLATVMRGGDIPRAPTDAATLLDAARREGVIAIVAERLAHHPAADPVLHEAFSAAGREAAAIAMLRNAECKRVVEALAHEGIPSLLLKGTALAWWLYPSAHLRECADIDLLFASKEAADRAIQVLSRHGFGVGPYPPGEAYEVTCRRTSPGALKLDIDIHWRLISLPVFAEVFTFSELDAQAIALSRLGDAVRGLSPVHAMMHACMHRIINLYDGIGDGLKWLYDLHLLASRFSEQDWAVLLSLCRERGLCGVCVDGFDSAARMFGTEVPLPILEGLRQAVAQERLDVRRLASWAYMERMNLASLPTTWRRFRWLWHLVFPPDRRGLNALSLRRVRGLVRRLRS